MTVQGVPVNHHQAAVLGVSILTAITLLPRDRQRHFHSLNPAGGAGVLLIHLC